MSFRTRWCLLNLFMSSREFNKSTSSEINIEFLILLQSYLCSGSTKLRRRRTWNNILECAPLNFCKFFRRSTSKSNFRMVLSWTLLRLKGTICKAEIFPQKLSYYTLTTELLNILLACFEINHFGASFLTHLRSFSITPSLWPP